MGGPGSGRKQRRFGPRRIGGIGFGAGRQKASTRGGKITRSLVHGNPKAVRKMKKQSILSNKRMAKSGR